MEHLTRWVGSSRRVQKPHPKYLAMKANDFLDQLEYDDPENSGVINGWYIPANIFKIFLTSFHLSIRSDREKYLEILILRQQLNILQRKHNQ
jgi:hypothetical protein